MFKSKEEELLDKSIAEQTEVVRKEQEKLDALIVQRAIAGGKISWPAVTTAAREAGLTITDVVRLLKLDPEDVLQVQAERKRAKKLDSTDA